MRVALILVLVACSPGPSYFEGDAGNFDCQPGPAIAITTSANEHFHGYGHVVAHQDISGSESMSIVVCGASGDTDKWRLEIDDATQPLSLAQGSTMSAPFPHAAINVVIGGKRSLDHLPTIGQLTAAGGRIDGDVVVGDPAIDAQFTGAFDFACSTNAPDPSFKTTFCQQFIALAPP